MRLRALEPADVARVLELNAQDVDKLSPLDADRLEPLLQQAWRARVVDIDGELAGFVIALREGSDYASPNYRWFNERFPVFAYVDRIVVDARYRGRGVAQALYADVFDAARRDGRVHVACEYDLDPPNPASARFHAAQGFVEVGVQVLANGKRVSMQAAVL